MPAPTPFDTTQITSPANRSQPQPGDPCHPLARGAHAPAVTVPAFNWPVDVADPVTANEGATYSHEGSHNFRMHNVVPAQVIGFQSNLGSHGGDVFDGVSPTMRIGSQSAKGGGNPPAVALPAVFTLEVRGREGERVLEYRTDGTANALRTSTGGRDGLGVGAISFYPNMGANARSDGARESVAGTLAGADGGNRQAVAFNTYQRTDGGEVFDTLGTNMLRADQGVREVGASMAVRRLTPRECERLQGFPDDWTLITYRGKPASDGPRYKALGNSMATNVMRWIGLRIAQAEGAP